MNTLENIKRGTSIDDIEVVAVRWNDRVNGNTYHKVAILLNGSKVYSSDSKYGYGRQFVVTASEVLKEYEIIDIPWWEGLRRYCIDNGINYTESVTDIKSQGQFKKW